MRERTIRAVAGRLECEFRAMPSKSVTHRALVTAALARGRSTILNPLDADDTRVTRDGLEAMGVEIRSLDDRWIVEGCGDELPGGGTLFLGESGTSMRFLTAVAALGAAPSELDGATRMRERPMHELVTALTQIGGAVSFSGSGSLPLRAGGVLPRGGAVRLPSGRSSQFASALLLIGPCLPGGLDLILEPPAVSLPYVELTADVLRHFGVCVERPDPLRWKVSRRSYPGREYRVEGDHSSASYLLAAAMIVGGRVRVRGLDPASAQPDCRLGEIIEDLGAAVGRGPDWVEVRGSGAVGAFDLEMSSSPDLVPTLAVIGLFADGPCVIRGIAHLRHKESDRLELLAENLRALGREARAVEDRLEIGPPPSGPRGGLIRTGSDHRIAMAFAVAGLRRQGIQLDDTACVAKSDPSFWGRLEALAG